MKITKHQYGGMIYTPVIDTYQPGQGPQNSQTASKSTSTTKEDTFIRDSLMDMLKENGLPNDVDAFINLANNLVSNKNSLDLVQGNNMPTMSQLLQLQSYANKIRHNNDMYTKASEHIRTTGNGSELALSRSGQLYATKDGELTLIDANTYSQHSDQYSLLTNADLMTMREYSGDLAFNRNIINDLNSSIGMEDIMDQVRTTIKDFGTLKESNKIEGMSKAQANSISAGMEQLTSGVTNTIETSSENQGYSDQASFSSAVNYLYSSLPIGMRNVLRANAAAMGVDPNNINDVQNILAQAVAQHTNHSTTYSNTQSGSSSSGSGSGGSNKTENLSRIESLVAGKGSAVREVNIYGNIDTTSTKVQAQDYSVTYPDGQRMNQSTVSDIISKGELGVILETNNMTFGDMPLTEEDTQKLVSNGLPTFHRVELPYKINDLGQTIPDISGKREVDELAKEIKSKGNITAQEIRLILNSYNADPNHLSKIIYNTQTKEIEFDPYSTKLFVMMEAEGYGAQLKYFNRESPWVKVIKDDEKGRKQQIKTIINKSLYDNYGEDAKTKYPGTWSAITSWGHGNDIYEGMVFIPVKDDYAKYAKEKALVPESNYMDLIPEDQRKQRKSEYNIQSKTDWDLN